MGLFWYVLYRDGIAHGVRRAHDLDGAIVVAGALLREGRDVVQLGPTDKKRRDATIGGHEIRRLCSELASLP
jgi:hypothetical protein